MAQSEIKTRRRSSAQALTGPVQQLRPLPAGEGKGLSRRSAAKADEGEPLRPDCCPASRGHFFRTRLMNTYIETLNHWSEIFLNFAGPMLWQSSLLIVVVFALDFLLARKIRPAVRHALWLVVLIKLLLPPALALPTGAAWWLWPAKPPLTPVIKTQTVTFDTAPLPDYTPQTIPIAPPPMRLSGAGWMALAAGAVSATLLAWLVVNWLTVARKTRRAHGLRRLRRYPPGSATFGRSAPAVAIEAGGRHAFARRLWIVSPRDFAAARARGKTFRRATPGRPAARGHSRAARRCLGELRADAVANCVLVAPPPLAGQRPHPPPARGSRGRRGHARPAR